MPLYSRSDLASVTVSPTAHGGCGATHVRPAPGGKPEALWVLDCVKCEDFLRHDPLWSATISEIPETYDEQKAREDFDRRGAYDRDQIMALAMAKLAGVELPESMRRPITGNLPHIQLPDAVAPVLCAQGHANLPVQRFCGECGASLSVAAPPEAPPAPPAAQESAPDVPAPDNGGGGGGAGGGLPSGAQVTVTATVGKFSLPSNTKMRGMKREELAVLATKAGIDPSGTRTVLLDRLIAANNGKGRE